MNQKVEHTPEVDDEERSERQRVSGFKPQKDHGNGFSIPSTGSELQIDGVGVPDIRFEY
ncbi:hypothetical protein AWB78_05330 [Caballeronia calidae]|uniref:Uncharacterized protein n=1 Tax=Caballeronia calidae TaxID=1777139 RepID=A0A158DL87_9BURK|nr:hypothetical protein [Caballeronia calidae]SAK95344.1 hypothetical protein AWB78_05330 [Caballeronia calidae]